MPTTVAFESADANAQHAFLNDPDFIAVIGFSAIGLLVAIGFVFFLPLPEDFAAMLIQVL